MRRWLYYLALCALALTILLALLEPTRAQQNTARVPFWIQGSTARAADSPRLRFSPDGFLRSAGAPESAPFSAGLAQPGPPEATAQSFLRAQARWFYDGSPQVSFDTKRVTLGQIQGRSYVKLQQKYDGLPVFGAEVTIQVRGANVETVLSDIMRDFSALDQGSISTTPALSAADAQTRAAAWAQSTFNVSGVETTAPELLIYDPQVIGNDGRPVLAWHLEVADPGLPLKESVFVDARIGKIVSHYSLIHEALNRKIYSAEHTDSIGFLMRSEGGAAAGIPDVDSAYRFYGDTYNFYFNEHGRDSINNAGMILSATVRLCPTGAPCPFPNAFWDGSRMWFGDGFTVDDVVSHELTHGVTQYESGLVYQNQSGAMNESLSDMWGEWVDLGNGAGTDTPEVRWLMGEDIPGIGAIRDMQDPTAFGDPDRMGSPNFYTGGGDNGGVHSNSGVSNKLAYLLSDGDTFNGYTVSPLGIPRTADLIYECQANLLNAASDYADFYAMLTQAAINLGFTAGEKASVENASRAVEIRTFEGVTGFQAETHTGVARVDLTWSNPLAPDFTEVRIRRGTAGFPQDPNSAGTLIYQGAGTSFVDTSLTLGGNYYYSIWAYHGAIDRSFPAFGPAQAGLVQSSPTELFTGAGNDLVDLDNRTLTFTPRGSAGYILCTQPAAAFPTNPATGTLLTLTDDSFVAVALTGGAQVGLFGALYNTIYVASNGRISFGGGSTDYIPDYFNHFSLPGISALITDLNPEEGGTIRTQQLPDRAAVTYTNVPEWGVANTNNFQIEMFFNGTIRITYLNVDATAGVAGISPGSGTPATFLESNLDVSSGGDGDGDLLSDCWELSYSLNPNSATGANGASGDPDGDGLSNLDEQINDTNPQDSDSDNDGLSDGWEVAEALDPNSSAGNDGAAGDPDADGLSNLIEQSNGTDPHSADTDNDGLDDGAEVNTHLTSPTNPDTDGDGETDGDEITFGTNPLASDAVLALGGSINDTTTQLYQVVVPASNPPKRIADLDVGLNIAHSFTGDLNIWLTSPTGTQVLLVGTEGGPGDNFTDTRMDDEAAASVVKASAPFTGHFRPESALSAFDGQNLQGTWTLTIQDAAAGDNGTLINWTLYPKLRRSLVYLNFSAGGGGNGTQAAPFNTFANALPWVNDGGTLKIQGNSAATQTISQNLRLETAGGLVRIGAP